MKLATRAAAGRDGQLMVVSGDLQRWRPARAAGCLRDALDDWAALAPALGEEARALAADSGAGEPFAPAACLAPLPRASQWADGSAYVNHVELVRRARGAELPDSFWHDPLMYMGAADAMLGPCADIAVGDEAWGIDMEAEIGVFLTDVPQGASVERALDAIALVGILNDISYRALIPAELAKGFGFFQSKGATAFAPVVVSPDELGPAWRAGKLHRPLHVELNGKPFGRAEAGEDMTFDFPTLVAHAARTRALSAGAIVGSGTVSNRDPDGSPGRPVAAGGRGYSCIAEMRMIETIAEGAPTTPFLRFGDRVRIEMFDDKGASLFGAIDQQVVRYD